MSNQYEAAFHPGTGPTDAEKRAVDEQAEKNYRATHGRDGGLLGVHYPDNRVGRRAMARTWKGK